MAHTGIRFYYNYLQGNSLICLKCHEKAEQQTNSLQKLDSHSFVIWAKQFQLKPCYSTEGDALKTYKLFEISSNTGLRKRTSAR